MLGREILQDVGADNLVDCVSPHGVCATSSASLLLMMAFKSCLKSFTSTMVDTMHNEAS